MDGEEAVVLAGGADRRGWIRQRGVAGVRQGMDPAQRGGGAGIRRRGVGRGEGRGWWSRGAAGLAGVGAVEEGGGEAGERWEKVRWCSGGGGAGRRWREVGVWIGGRGRWVSCGSWGWLC